MGGAGKTTLAKVVYERIENQFDGSYFLHDVRETAEKEGFIELQRKLLANVKVKNMEIKDQHDGRKTIKNLLCNKKILLVLDDVSAIGQLENLVGNQNWFGPGSRVIVTTRDKHVMETHGNRAFGIFEVKLLNIDDSFQLLYQKAFKGNQPKDEYLEVSKSVVQYVRGLPLTLEVLGSFLYGRSIPEWKDTLNKLEQHSEDVILKTLRLSYDGLEYAWKTIFLDIACFFKGWDRNRVTHILQICGRNPTIGIEVLIEKALITCNDECLEMHDLLQGMGKYIVLHESLDDASKRSRLWSMKDIDHVLAKDKEIKEIQGIVLNLPEPHEVHWNPESLSNLCNLKMLILRTNLHLSNGLNCLSNALRVFEWERYPLQSLPFGTLLDDLVDIKLHHSKIKRLWSGAKSFQKLKFVDLSHSKYLSQTPNVFGIPHLETLILEGCINLVKVHQSIPHHKKLATLNLKDCLNLKILPKKLEMNSFESLILSSCSKVTKLPEFGENMKCLSKLDLKDCKNLLFLPSSIHNLKALKVLNISGCSKFSKMSNNVHENEALEELDISGTAIRKPSSIIHLENLQNSAFQGCKASSSISRDLSLPFRWLQMFKRHPNPIGLMLSSVSQWSMLKELDLSYCNLGDGSLPIDLCRLSSLESLDLSGNNFANLPTSLARLSKLSVLSVNHCARLQSLPTLPPRLEQLDARNCGSMELVSYSQQLHDFFTSTDNYLYREATFFCHVSGSEIPTWFDNQNYYHKDFLISKFPEFSPFDSVVSMIVDVPCQCRSNKSWGIAVCLVLEHTPTLSSFEKYDVVWWNCKAPEADYNDLPAQNYHYHLTKHNEPHLFIFVLSANDHPAIKDRLVGDKEQLEFVFYSRSIGERGEKEAKFKIRKCGCRLLWKGNEEISSHASTESKQCQQDGVEEDDATLSTSHPSK